MSHAWSLPLRRQQNKDCHDCEDGGKIIERERGGFLPPCPDYKYRNYTWAHSGGAVSDLALQEDRPWFEPQQELLVCAWVFCQILHSTTLCFVSGFVLFFFFFCDIFESFIAMATIHYHVFETDGSRVYRWSMTSMLFFSSEERKGLCGQEEQRLRRSSGQLRAQHHQGLWHTSHHRQGGRCRPQQSQNRWQSTRRQEDVQQREQNWQDVKDFVSCSFWQL